MDPWTMQQMVFAAQLSQQKGKKGCHRGGRKGADDKHTVNDRNVISRALKQPEKLCIFVSSTFSDMSQERDIFARFAFPEIQSHCTKYGIVPTFVDLRWGVTSAQVRSKDAVTICLSHVAKADIVVGFLGNRYGWHVSPQNSNRDNANIVDSIQRASTALEMPWLESMTDCSVTELELRCAEKWVHYDNILVFAREDNDSEPVESCSVGLAKLNALKEEFSASSTKYNLNQASENINASSALRQLIVDRVVQTIDKICAGKEKLAKWDRERALHRQVAAVACRGFTKTAAITEIEKGWTQKHICFVSAEHGLGKTAACGYFLDYFEKDANEQVIVHVVGCAADSILATNLVRRILFELGAEILEKVSDGELQQELLGAVEKYAELHPEKHLTIIVDGLDAITEGDVFDFLPLHLKTLKWLFTCQEANWKAFKVRTKHIKSDNIHVRLYPLALEEARVVMSEKLAANSKKFSADQWKAVMTHPHAADILSSPLWITLFVNELCLTASFETLEATIEALLTRCPTVEQLITSILQELSESLGRQGQMIALCVVAVLSLSHIGLSETELAEAMELAPHTVFVILRRLSPLLIDRFGFFVASNALRRFAASNVSQNLSIEVHKKLATFFQRQKIDGRTARELPHHLIASSQFGELGCLLAHPQVMHALYSGYKKALYMDYWKQVREATGKSVLEFIKVSEHLGNGSLQCIRDAIRLSRVLAAFGHFQQCYDVLLAAAAAEERTNSQLAAADSCRLEILKRLAMVLIALGNFQEGMKYAEKALMLASKTAASSTQLLGVLAHSYKKQGNYADAIRFYNQAVAETERLVVRNPSLSGRLAALFTELGDALRKESRHDEALRLLNKALAINIKQHGEEHPTVALTKFSIAQVQKKLGKYSAALKLCTECIRCFSAVYGEEHPSVSNMLSLKGDCALKLGQYDLAHQIYSDVLRLNTKLIGPEHVDTIEASVNLALIEKKEAQYQSAEKRLQEALEKLERLYGNLHPKTLHVMSQLSDCERKIGKFDTALERSRQTVSLSQQLYGDIHIEVADALVGYAALLLKKEAFEEARDSYQKVLNITTTLLGENHVKCAVAYAGLGDACRKILGSLLTARDHYDKALAITIQVYGEDHIETAELYYKMGRLKKKMHWYGDAEKSFLAAIDPLINAFKTTSHPKVSLIQQSLGDVYRKQFKLSHAKDLYNQALATNVKFFGDCHEEVAECLNGLGLCAAFDGNREEGVQLLIEAVEMTVKCLGEQHRHTIKRKANLEWAITGKHD